MTDLLHQLAEILDDSQLVTGDALRARAVSYWDASPTCAKALIYPRTTQQVSQVMALCNQHSQTVVTQGGLTGCVEGAVSQANDIILSLEKMNDIEDIDLVGNTATVQAGVILQSLQEACEQKELRFPLDLGARGSCTIGGNASTNAGGINVIRYGMMRNLVLGLEAVLPDGTIVSSMNSMMKNNSGYDLKQLFIGTEGTLGIITRLVVRLFPLPTSDNTALVALNSFDDVTRLLNILQSRLAGNLSAFEVMWNNYYHAVTEPGWHRAPMERTHPFYVLVTAEGFQAETDRMIFERVLEEVFEAGLLIDAIIPKSRAEAKALWDIREDFEAILSPAPVHLYDVSLPIKHMAAYVEEVSNLILERWPQARFYSFGHIGDGNLHFFIAPIAGDDSHTECDELVYQPLARFNGAISAEHGIGTEKKRWLSQSRSDAELSLMRVLKSALDPQGLLNPNCVF